jgi:TolB-like protein
MFLDFIRDKIVQKKLKITILSSLIILSNTFINNNFSYADKKLKIAILPFTNLSEKKENDWIGSGFSETMLTSLSNLKSIQITERFLMNQVLKEISFQKSGFIEDKNLVKVGKLTGANIIVSGSYQIVNNEIVVNSRYIDVEKGTVESGGAFYIRGDVNKIFDLEEKLANDFKEKFSIVSTEQEENNIKSTIYATSSIEANKLYLKAIERNINGGYTGQKEAISLLKEALKLDPNYFLALALLGQTQMENASLEEFFNTYFKTNVDVDFIGNEGLENLKKSLKNAPDSLEVNRLMAKALLDTGEKEKSEKYLDKALSINENDIESILLKGKIHKDKRLDYINKAYSIDNHNYYVYLDYGTYYLYSKEKDLTKAVTNLLKAIEINPNSWMANMQIVQAYIKAKDFKSSTAWADRLLLIQKDKFSYMMSASAYVYSQDYNKITYIYEEVDKLDSSPFVKSTLSSIYIKSKDYVKAFNFIRKSLEIYPNDPYLNLYMSEVYTDYYKNCKFALYHYKIYLKSIDKGYFTEEMIKKEKENANNILKDMEKNCKDN